jgi:hypothetical protein
MVLLVVLLAVLKSVVFGLESGRWLLLPGHPLPLCLLVFSVLYCVMLQVHSLRLLRMRVVLLHPVFVHLAVMSSSSRGSLLI